MLSTIRICSQSVVISRDHNNWEYEGGLIACVVAQFVSCVRECSTIWCSTEYQYQWHQVVVV